MRKLLEHPGAVAGMSLEHIQEDCRLIKSSSGEWSLRLVEAKDEHRKAAEQFIGDAYHKAFQARITHFYPSIVVLEDRREALCGAVGARSAHGQDLFLEQYLERPVTDLISLHTQRKVERFGVVEMGNLSVSRPALTYPYMSLIGAWLETFGVQWLVFALTRTLRCLFRRSGVDMVELCEARPERLGAQAASWGRYYDHQPVVVAMELKPALQRFNSFHPVPRVHSLAL